MVLQAAEAEFDAYLQAAAHCESEGFETCLKWHFLISSELVTTCIVFFSLATFCSDKVRSLPPSEGGIV